MVYKMSEKVIDMEQMIRKALDTDKVVIGYNDIFSLLKEGKLSHIVFAKNSPKELVDELKYYASFKNETILVEFDGLSDKLNILVRKPFLISFIGILV